MGEAMSECTCSAKDMPFGRCCKAAAVCNFCEESAQSLRDLRTAALLALGLLWMTERQSDKVHRAYTTLRDALGGKEALREGIQAAMNAGHEAGHPQGADWWAGKKDTALHTAGAAGPVAAHSKSEHKRRVAQGDPSVLPPAGVAPAAPGRPLGCLLAMRVMQSDLYHALDDAERADCDALVRKNLNWFKADTAGVAPAASGPTQPWGAVKDWLDGQATGVPDTRDTLHQQIAEQVGAEFHTPHGDGVEPCPRGDDKPEPTCANRHQCWEPCGELGKSAEHTVAVPESAGLPPRKPKGGSDAG